MDANAPYLIPLSFAFISITCHVSTYIQIRVPLGPTQALFPTEIIASFTGPIPRIISFQFTQLPPNNTLNNQIILRILFINFMPPSLHCYLVFYLLFHTLLERNRVIGVVFIFFSVVIFEFLGNVGCI